MYSHSPRRRFLQTTELLEAALLDDGFSAKELLRLHGTSHRVMETIDGSQQLLRKLWLAQRLLPKDILPGRFKAAAAVPNWPFLQRDPTEPFRIPSQPGRTFLMYYIERHDPHPSPFGETSFMALNLYRSELNYRFPGGTTPDLLDLPELILDMYLTDLPIANVVHFQQGVGPGEPMRQTHAFFPAGTTLKSVLQFQDLWAAGAVQEGQVLTGVPGLDGSFFHDDLLRLPGRNQWAREI